VHWDDMTINIDSNKIQEFQEVGFTIVNISALIPKLSKFKKEIYEVFSLFSERSKGAEINDDQGVIKFRMDNQILQYKAVKHLWNNPHLSSIGGDQIFLKVLKSFGFVKPSFEYQPLFRCDMPVKGQSIFHQHQDYVYNIGSNNSVTVWIPLQDVDESMGALKVEPRSHKNGIYPNKKGIIKKEYKFDFLSVPIEFGNALIFNQKLVHQSGENISNQIRFSIQLRFTDLGCISYAERGYPQNHIVVTQKFAGDVAN
jgi:ectoine hydroxylase-related dioxygenase (phytanoyl-CoA dioxygenase family)